MVRIRLPFLLLVLIAFATPSAFAQDVPDHTPPIITSGPTALFVPPFTSADIVWTTDEPSAGALEISLSATGTPSFPLSLGDDLKTSWQVTLPGLTPRTVFYVRVLLFDQYGNGPTISPWVSFGDSTPPVISGPTFSLITFTSADILWTTDELSTGQLEFARSLDDPHPLVADFNNRFLTSWQVSFTGLTPHTTYYVRVGMIDQYGNGPAMTPWVSFRTLGEDPPAANAGADQSISYGQVVTLDGSKSFDDNTPTQSLQFAWTLSIKPHGSAAVLSNPHAPNPTFVADLPGLYEASLTVTDLSGQRSAPDTVRISSINLPPTADAGSATSGYVGQAITLDGSASSDPEGEGLLYAWVLTGKPAGSTANLNDGQSVTPTLIPDVAGQYRVQLIVRDHLGLFSEPAETEVVIVTTRQYADSLIVATEQRLNELPDKPTAINEGHRTALTQFLLHALRASARADLSLELGDLEAALVRMDGCAIRGAADGLGPDLDWITDCSEQEPLYELLAGAVRVLQR